MKKENNKERKKGTRKKNKLLLKLPKSWNDPSACNSLYTLLGYAMSHHGTKFFLAFVLIGLNITLFICDFNDFSPFNRKAILLFVINMLFIIVIMIFVIVAKSIAFRIDKMREAFPQSKNYQKYVQAYHEWIGFGRKKYNGKCQVHIWWRLFYIIIYIVLWFATIGSLIWYACCDAKIASHYLGIYAVILYVLSMFFMGYTFFSTLAYILFLYNLSSTANHCNLIEYQYNNRIPCITAGFMQLKTDISIHAVCYMSVSLLYSVALPFVVAMDYSNPFKHFFYDNSIEFYIMTMLFGALCVIGSFLVYPMPLIMLKRILLLWNNQTIHKCEDEIIHLQKQLEKVSMLSIEEKTRYEKRIDCLEAYITQTRTHSSVLKNSILPAILTLLEFISPVLSFIVSAAT